MWLENYKEMFIEGGILRGFLNSMGITVICVLLLVLLCSAMAFVLQRKKSLFSKAINMVVILAWYCLYKLSQPTLCVTFSTFPMCWRLCWCWLWQICPLLFFCIPDLLKVFLWKSMSLPGWTERDRCSFSFGLFFHCFSLRLLPRLSLISWRYGMILEFRSISSTVLEIIRCPLTIYNFFGNHSSDWQLVFANVVLSTLPVAIVYLILQKYIISGMTAGAVKG